MKVAHDRFGRNAQIAAIDVTDEDAEEDECR